ncbi:MAG TPA: c-type cytochrome [Gammaproteobacteria bacterium]
MALTFPVSSVRTAKAWGSPLVAALAACLCCGGAAAQTFTLADLSGEELFERFCAACHGPEGRGDGPVARTLNVLVPDLTQIATRRGGRFPAFEIRETIDGRALVTAHGTRTMPVWGYEFWVEQGGDVVAEREARSIVDRLVEYLESIQEEDRSRTAR